MNIGILGTGVVGESLGSALIQKGHNVLMGARQAGNEKAVAWVEKTGAGAAEGSFAEAALFGEVVFISLNGEHALEAVRKIDRDRFAGKMVIDTTNPLDFSSGMPPRILEEFRTTSLGEKIQETLPDAFVVKTLNTVNYKLMVDARIVNDGAHNLFICGNDTNVKNRAKQFLADNFYWKPDRLIDLGSIHSARTTEAIVPFWVLVYQALGTPLFNFNIVQ